MMCAESSLPGPTVDRYPPCACQSGSTHLVQFKTTLADANWQTLTTIPGDGARKQVTDPLGAQQRFYRVISQ